MFTTAGALGALNKDTTRPSRRGVPSRVHHGILKRRNLGVYHSSRQGPVHQCEGRPKERRFRSVGPKIYWTIPKHDILGSLDTRLQAAVIGDVVTFDGWERSENRDFAKFTLLLSIELLCPEASERSVLFATVATTSNQL